MQISDLVEFRNDLFFGGAVQLDWIYGDAKRAQEAASNFVFHGPKYHGVKQKDSIEEHILVDTATFTKLIVESALNNEKEDPIALAIAGYGTGKSHLAVMLASLLGRTNPVVEESIIQNLMEADIKLGAFVRDHISSSKPHLVISINGMRDFNLSSELSIRILEQVESVGLPTEYLEELWPRFKIATDFCIRNYDVRKELFDDICNGMSLAEIETSLQDHDEIIYEKISRIYFQTVGSYINAIGQESPQELIATVINEYCGDNGYFQGVVVLFDEFGRYLEFAAQKPQIAGDAAIQQLFEAVQSNSTKCYLVCFNQYELRAYLSRVASELQVTLQRYITRFDSARKFYLSSNLETLFAHLLRKKNLKFLESHLQQPIFKQTFIEKQQTAVEKLSKGHAGSVWTDFSLFSRVIVQGCWPLDPIATWLLSNISSVLQNRSALAILKNSISHFDSNVEIEYLSLLTACDVARFGLVDEFLANEKFGLSSAETELYSVILDKLANTISVEQKNILLAILLYNKLHISSQKREEACYILQHFSGLNKNLTDVALDQLQSDYGVIEWNETQRKFDLISDAIPRSRFINFLDRNVKGFDLYKVEAIFESNSIEWCRLNAPVSSFGSRNNIGTTEWAYSIKTTTVKSLGNIVSSSYAEWLTSIEPNQSRGTIIYCFFPESSIIENAKKLLQNEISNLLNNPENKIEIFPFYIIPIIDKNGDLTRSMTEQFILTSNLPSDEISRFRHFIDDHKSFLIDELPRIFDRLILECREHAVFPDKLNDSLSTVKPRKVPDEVFAQIYPNIVDFPFDGFSTLKGNAARDCRELTIELINGNATPEWISTKNKQFQNRYNVLLSESGQNGGGWGFIDPRGKFKIYPSNKKARLLVDMVDLRLEKSREVSITEIFEDWVRPPIGLNLASAGLLLAAYLAGRSDSHSITLKNQNISRKSWILNVLGRSYIDLRKVGDSKLRIIDENHIDEWKKLLEQWEIATFYSKLVHFEHEAEELTERIGFPSETLQYKREMLTERNKVAHKEIDKFKRTHQNYEESFALAIEKKNSGKQIHLCQKIISKIDEMKDTGCWQDHEFEPFFELLGAATSAAKESFDDWLESLYVGNVAQIERFEHQNRTNSNTLRKLDLSNLALRLDKKNHQLTRNLNVQRKISQVFDTVDTFKRTQYFTAVSTMQEIEKIIQNANALISDLERIKNDDNFKAIENRQNKLKTEYLISGEKQKAKNSERLSCFYDVTHFENIDRLREAQIELDTLNHIFQGKDNDLEDIVVMQLQIGKLLDAAEYLEREKAHFSIKSLEINLKQLEDDYISSFQDGTDIEWNFKDTLDPIFINIKENINRLSKEWMRTNIDGKNIRTFGFASCNEFLGTLSNLPVFLTEEDQKKVSTINIEVQERMDMFRVEKIISDFVKLDEEQQKNCIVKIKQIIKNQ